MAFSDKAAEDARTILIDCGEFSESVQYQNHAASGVQPWKTLTVMVEDESSVPPPLGAPLGRRGPRAVYVSVLKDAVDGIAAPQKERDRIKRFPGTTQEQVFRVIDVDDDTDPGWWRLYAVP